ncbi:MAG: LysR family transcriptional regulator [Casimicrobiaceae bacterium]|nr:LysR family transcriptional regulator [Casimicrobiaceae bacterium]MCX8097490.1 LysR family transcriptional regulator [Casimicrobiaceae bacterium]MDW8311208.1 LysR family transcriptional regulator [Burkholderiales bacterium]
MSEAARGDRFDLHLLRVLYLVLTERSVSRAADRLGISQPAVSASLKRLRELTGDDLIVRTRSGMTPTERALSLIEPLRQVLEGVDRIFDLAERFEAAASTRTFGVGAPDYFDAFFLSRLSAELRRQAPQARLTIRALSLDVDFERLLEEGELDVVIGNWPHPPPYLRTSPLFDDEVVCLLAQSHPLAKKSVLTGEDYLAAKHLAPVPYAGGVRGAIDEHLYRLGLRRDIRMALPYFHVAPYVVAQSDLIFTTGRRFAEPFTRLLPLVLRRAPLEFPPLRFYQLWHERTHHSAAARWLRALIAEVARG